MGTRRYGTKLSVIEDTLQKSMGNISVAARSLGMTRNALYQRIKRTPQLKTILDDARESLVDVAESALYSAVTKKEGWAVCFTLKTIGKSRGYIERTELIQRTEETPLEEMSDVELAKIIKDAAARLEKA
jgi:hypothetical protein